MNPSAPLVERLQFYVFPAVTTNAAGSIQESLTLPTDDDAPFRLAGIAIWTNDVAGGAFDSQMSLRFQRPDGRLTQRLFMPGGVIAPGNSYGSAATSTGANPNQGLISPVHPNIIYPPKSVITLDIETLATAPASPSAIVAFVGTKLYKQGSIWAPTYPPKFTARPYLNSLFVPNVTIQSGPVLNQPFIVENDADFVFQLGMYSDLGTAGTFPDSLVDLGFIMRDAFGQAYSNTYVPIGLLFPFLTAQQAGWTFPEIYIPAQQLLLFDFAYLWS